MARPFNVTTAAESVRLDAQGRGAITITVSNISGRARRGRARLVPGDPGQASWLSLDGEAEREFTADGTQQFVARIAVPAGTPAGKFTFGVDVVSVENPDEEFTQGPKVAYEVAPPPPVKPFPWWIVVAVVAVLLVGGLVAWLAQRGKAPEKTGLQGSCETDAGCADLLSCVRDQPSDPKGVCLGKVSFNGCRRPADCGTGLTCQAGACVGALRFPSCQQDAECATGLTCAGNQCVGAKGFNGCAQNSDCATNLCINGSCTDKTTMANCSSDAGCAPGESCVAVGSAKLCLRQTGQSCTQPLECVTRNCGGGVCQAGTGSCLSNPDCTSPYLCINQVCLIPNGQPCSGDLQCQSGNCRGGSCQEKPCLNNQDCGRFGSCVNNKCLYRWGGIFKEEILRERVVPQFKIPHQP